MSSSIAGSLVVLFVALTIVLGAIGILLLFVRPRAIDHPSCGGCGYDVSVHLGSASRCPECGADFAEVGVRPRGRSWSGGRVAALVVVIILVVGCGGSTLVSTLGLYTARRATQTARVAQARAAQATAASRDAAAAESAGPQDAAESGAADDPSDAPLDP